LNPVLFKKENGKEEEKEMEETETTVSSTGIRTRVKGGWF